MATTNPSIHAKRARWQNLWHTLHAVRFEPPPKDADIDRVLDALPKPLPGNRLDSEGFGSQKLADPDHPYDWANRRVEIVNLSQGGN